MIEEAELSGYLDGELSPEHMKKVELALRAQPELADKLSQLRTTDALLQRCAHEMSEAPIPESNSAWLIKTTLITTALVILLTTFKATAYFATAFSATLIEVIWLGLTLLLMIRVIRSLALPPRHPSSADPLHQQSR